jgi:hypothetical protein
MATCRCTRTRRQGDSQRRFVEPTFPLLCLWALSVWSLLVPCSRFCAIGGLCISIRSLGLRRIRPLKEGVVSRFLRRCLSDALQYTLDPGLAHTFAYTNSLMASKLSCKIPLFDPSLRIDMPCFRAVSSGLHVLQSVSLLPLEALSNCLAKDSETVFLKYLQL